MCCKNVPGGRWSSVWTENGRKYRLSCHTNAAGRFLRCTVRDGEDKRHNIIFLEGKGLVRGWDLVAKKLRELDVSKRQKIKDYGTTLGYQMRSVGKKISIA